MITDRASGLAAQQPPEFVYRRDWIFRPAFPQTEQSWDATHRGRRAPSCHSRPVAPALSRRRVSPFHRRETLFHAFSAESGTQPEDSGHKPGSTQREEDTGRVTDAIDSIGKEAKLRGDARSPTTPQPQE